MKKKFLIGFIILLVCLLLFGTSAALVIHSGNKELAKKEDNTNLVESENIENLNNESRAEDDRVQEVEERTEEKHEEEVVTTNENRTNIDNKSTTPLKKDTQEKVTTTTNDEKKETTKTKENPQKTNNTQVEQPASKETNASQNKELEEIKEKLSCTDGKHYMDVGNSGKWFDTEAEAVTYYKSIIKTWGEKWENFEIDDETYNKNCPYRYEVWSCFCGKWTINFYYN